MSLAKRSPHDRRRPDRDPIRTRSALLHAAFAEFHRSGFRGADLEAILGTAKVTKGALYHHFESKEALGRAVLEEVIADIMRQKWALPLARAGNPVDALIAIVQSTSLKEEHVCCGCPLNNFSQEMSPLDEGFRKRAAKIFRAWHAAIASALRRGIAQKAVRADVEPDEAATFLIAAYEGYMSLGKSSQDGSQLRKGLKTLIHHLESMRANPRGKRIARRARGSRT